MYSKTDVIHMLSAEGRAQEALFEEAQRLRRENCNDEIVFRGVVEVTNLCRVDCDYCPMRRSNSSQIKSFVLSSDEVMQAAREIFAQGIDVVFFQGGEIPQTTGLLVNTIPRV